MTAARAGLTGLPGWPLWLSREQAAGSPTHFDAEVDAGRWARGVDRGLTQSGRIIRWWRPALDDASESLAKSRGAARARVAGTTMAEAHGWAVDDSSRDTGSKP